MVILNHHLLQPYIMQFKSIQKIQLNMYSLYLKITLVLGSGETTKEMNQRLH
jgi:hypothetical protein